MRAAVLLLCAAAFASGCGDDDGDDTTVETTPVTQIETVPAPAEPDVTTPDQMGEDVVPGDGAPAGADNGAAEAPRHCGRITFSKSSDSGASGITAAGTDCFTAKSIASASTNVTGELRYQAEGFTCAGSRSENAGLASIEWFCIGAEREVVTFVTT